MTVRPKGNKFQADFMYEGRRLRAAFSTSEEARRWEAQTRLDLEAGKAAQMPKGFHGGGLCKTIGELVDYAQTHHWASKGRKAEGGRQEAKPGANAGLFRDWVGPKTDVQAALTTHRVAEYVAHLEATGRASATINRHLSAISVLVKYGMDASVSTLQTKPIINWQKEGKGRLRYLTEEEVAQLLKYLRHIGREDDALFYEFLVDTGARFGEAVRLKWRDLSVGDKTVTFHDTKNAGLDTKSRTIPLTKRAKAGIAAMRARKGNGTGPWADVNVFSQTAVWRRLQTAMPWLADATPHHTFRHTTASWLVQRGVPLYRVKTWMGHSTMVVTERYAHLAPHHMTELASVLEAAE